MGKKMTWRRSDLWPFTLFFGLLTLILTGWGLYHYFGEHDVGSAFGSTVAAMLPFVLTMVCGMTDRSQAYVRDENRPGPVKFRRNSDPSETPKPPKRPRFLDW